MASHIKYFSLRIVFPTLVVVFAWFATARADELLDKQVSFHISASPLTGALIEFSAQSNIKVAAADADVTNLNTNGVNGTMPVGAALTMLLRGTGMEFARVGDETVAIRSASNGPPASRVAPADASGASSETPATTITVPSPPSVQELAGDSVDQFILHHVTTHYTSNNTTRNLSRWRGGLQSICPLTEGLTPAYNAFVTARIRAVAAYVGAPVMSDPQCKSNVHIIFTDKPEEKMQAIVQWATGPAFGNRYSGGGRNLLAFTSNHAVQGWYLATRGGSSVLNTDLANAGLNVWPLWPQITQSYNSNDTTGTHLGGGSGSGSGVGLVILVADQAKIVGNTAGTLADYLAMLTLTVVQSPDHCDRLPSILDLMSSSCGARDKPTAMTAGDLAFLKALYYKNTGLGPSLSRSDINDNMMRQFTVR